MGRLALVGDEPGTGGGCRVPQFSVGTSLSSAVVVAAAVAAAAVVVAVVVAVAVAAVVVVAVVVVVAQRIGASEGDVICFHTRLQLQRDVVQ